MEKRRLYVYRVYDIMVTYFRLNSYNIMWLFVFFDLPTNTKKERRDAARFRKDLEKDGFSMMQYSVYIRHCASNENKEVHMKRIRYLLPPSGSISILSITDKQYSEMNNYWGQVAVEGETTPVQLELF